MKKKLLLVIMMTAALRVMAVPAFPEFISFTQPATKETITILLKGDEFVHWAESEDGYSLLHGDDGSFYYAMHDAQGNMIPSPYIVTGKARRPLHVTQFLTGIEPHLRYSKQQVEDMLKIWNNLDNMKRPTKEMSDVLGEKRFLVILFAFQDQEFSHNKRQFEDLFNQVNYSANANNGSVHDYYYEVSQGLFSLQVDVVGPFTGTRNTAHYGNSNSGYQDFAVEAVDSASHYVNFSDYDNDGDGYIDGLHIIFAGHGEEASGNSDQIWSHKWNIFSSPEYDSTVVNVYSCSPECSGSNGSDLTAIGVICHELGHVFGAPDYYDTDYASSGGDYPGLGKWDIMSSGSWNRSGKCPAQHNPYTKIFVYKWATCDTLTDAQQVILRPSSQTNEDFYRINTGTRGDFFLLENRQQENWDIGTAGHGMLVYHVHPDARGARISNASHPQEIYILACTQDTFPSSDVYSYGLLDDASTPYPGSTRRSSLTDYTTPALRPWSQTLNHTPITHISENTSSGEVFFCFKDATPTLHGLDATGVSNSDVKLQWKGYGSMNVLLTTNTEEQFTTPSGLLRQGDTLANGDIVAYRGNLSTINLNNLSSNTTYYYRLYLLLDDTTYAADYLSDSATTHACAATAWRNLDFNDCTSDCVHNKGWNIDVAAGLAHSNPASQDTSLLVLPPFCSDSGHAMQHFVLSFDATNSDASLQLQVLLKNSIDSAWYTAYTFDSIGSETLRYYVPLYNCTRYSKVALQAVHHGDATGNASISVGNIALTAGCLLHSFVPTGGGTLSIEGYNILPQDTTIQLIIRRDPGYKFVKIFVDDKRKFPIRDTVLQITMDKYHKVECTFERDLAIQASNEERELHIYPNPTQGHVTLHSETTMHVIEFYSIDGKLLLSHRLQSNNAKLDLSAYPKGTYFLRITTATAASTKKLVIR